MVLQQLIRQAELAQAPEGADPVAWKESEVTTKMRCVVLQHCATECVYSRSVSASCVPCLLLFLRRVCCVFRCALSVRAR